jgi:putative phosphoesterase
MRIAVIADTHNHLPLSLLDAVAGADEIWHLGDVTEPRIIAEIAGLGRPLKIVRGNCDDYPVWPMELEFTLAGLKIRLVHIPPVAAPDGADLLLHGHTHVPRRELVGRTWFLNPGCITRPNRGAPASYAWLTLEEGRPFGWEIHPAQRT